MASYHPSVLGHRVGSGWAMSLWGVYGAPRGGEGYQQTGEHFSRTISRRARTRRRRTSSWPRRRRSLRAIVTGDGGLSNDCNEPPVVISPYTLKTFVCVVLGHELVLLRLVPEQLKGLAAYDDAGNLCAQGIAGEGTDQDLLTDEEVVKLPEDVDQPLHDHLVQLKGGLPRLKRNIADRDPQAKPTASKFGAAAVLRKLARERIEGLDGAVPSPAAEGAAPVAPCTPSRAAAGGAAAASPMDTE